MEERFQAEVEGLKKNSQVITFFISHILFNLYDKSIDKLLFTIICVYRKLNFFWKKLNKNLMLQEKKNLPINLKSLNIEKHLNQNY